VGGIQLPTEEEGSVVSESKHYRRSFVILCVSAFCLSNVIALDVAHAAATPKTITTCTNIKTNAMRLLIKGACNKKTEKTQLWIPKPSTIATPNPQPSETVNTTKFNEYFSDFYLGKMNIGKIIGTDGFPTKTTVFTKGTDLFCTMMSVKKTIAGGHVGNAIYDVIAKTYVQPKTTFPGEITAGGSGGCSSLDQTAGQYQDKIYIDDILVAVLPFEVK